MAQVIHVPQYYRVVTAAGATAAGPIAVLNHFFRWLEQKQGVTFERVFFPLFFLNLFYRPGGRKEAALMVDKRALGASRWCGD